MIFIEQSYTLELDTEIDVSTASVKKIYFRKPNGTSGEKVATATTPTGSLITSGLSVDFTVAENNLLGKWQYQGYVVVSGKDYYSKIHELIISQNLTN